MLIALDIGNSRIKCGIFEGDILLSADTISIETFEVDIQNLLRLFPKSNTIIAASVKNFDHDRLRIFDGLKIIIVDREHAMPFKNLYRTPETLGIDRMVLAAGATLLFPGQSRLIIDSGTCITYDFVNADNEYLGGAISPGLMMRYKSMNVFTDKLPLLSPENPQATVGNSTVESIHSGVVNGLVFEIEGFCKTYSKNLGNFIIILTGGDSVFLANRFKNTIFATPNFLLESLNALHLYQIKNA